MEFDYPTGFDPYIDIKEWKRDRVETIDQVSREVDDRLDALKKLKAELDPNDDPAAAIVLYVQIAQLTDVSSYVLELTEDDDDEVGDPLDLDNPGLLQERERILPFRTDLPQDVVNMALQEGELRGTNDFLAIVVPEGVPSRYEINPLAITIPFQELKRYQAGQPTDLLLPAGLTTKEDYFSVLTRQEINALPGGYTSAETPILLCRPTRLHDIFVQSFYPPFTEKPQRYISRVRGGE